MMRVPTAAELLDVWEDGLAEPPPVRTVRLLAAADADSGVEAIAALPVGRRDGCLLALRERLFGPVINVVTACPRCGEAVESTFRADDVRIDPQSDQNAAATVAADGLRITYRLPDSRDLIAIAGARDDTEARRTLFQRCVVEARDARDETIAADAIPERCRAAVARAMADADPQADVSLAMVCPACGHDWRAPFEIAGHVWCEIHAWALRTLRDVHALARAYGWRESEVLALGPTRRHLYLTLNRS